MIWKGSLEGVLGEIEDSSRGSSGSWTEEASPPFVTYSLSVNCQVRLSLIGGDFSKDVISVGDNINFYAGQDENGYDGDGEGAVRTIVEVGYGDVVVTFDGGSVTYMGMTPPQSQKGCM